MSIFQAYHHEISYEGDDLTILLWCLDENNENVLFSVKGFYFSFYVEIERENATEARIDKLKYHISELTDFSQTCRKKPFYGYQETKDLFLECRFRSRENMNRAKNKLTKSGIAVRDGDPTKTKFNVHESGISPIRKLYTKLNIKYCDWFSVKKSSLPVTRTVRCAHYEIQWDDIVGINDDSIRISRPLCMSYDIEAYSDNDREFPVSTSITCACYMISCTFQNIGVNSSREYYCLFIGPKIESDKYILQNYDTEFELLKGFFDLIRLKNPSLLTGYNICGFDNEYIVNRATIYGCKDIPSLFINVPEQNMLKTRGIQGNWSKQTSSLLISMEESPLMSLII